MTHSSADNQMLLPEASNGAAFTTATISRDDIPDSWLGADVFGLTMDGASSDPRLNNTDSTVIAGTQQGHYLRIFQAYDAFGEILDNVYIGAMDYPGINYDYNDNVFVFEGITPVGTGPTEAIADAFPEIAGTPFDDIA